MIGGATGDENQAYFSVYVPENIQTAKQTCQGVYNNREAFKGTGKIRSGRMHRIMACMSY